jgi:tRNA nucleotidyltransferase (CCA-adding enzyme)
VKEFLTPYGGSGHLQAGSAALTNQDPRELLKELEAKLPAFIMPFDTVESVMTFPVMAVSPDARVSEAYRAMLRFGYQALPVALDGEVLGMMTRKDLDKAHLHGFDRALVRDFMTEGIISVTAEASVNEAHRLMATYGFERLPVLQQGRLVGLMTRADLVRALYQTYRVRGEKETKKGFLWMEDIRSLLEVSFPSEMLSLLRRIGEKTQKMDMKAYIVGGAVRDILKGERNVDLDISVEGDAEVLARSWSEEGCRVTIHGRYKTGTIVFPGGYKVDIATARREFYEYAAAMPEVSGDSLKQDLARRDFTVNSMAVSLSKADWGTLIDFYGGRRDLKEGLLRVLHNLSFVEDPSRILRGIRLEQRLDMKFEDNALRLLNSAVKGGLLEKLSSSRLRTEVELNCKDRQPRKIAERMQELKIWDALFPGLRFGPSNAKKMRYLQKFLYHLKKENLSVFKGMEWLTYIAAILSESSLSVRSSTMDRLNFTPQERKILMNCFTSPLPVEQFFNTKKNFKNSEIFLFLKDYDPVPLLYCMATLKKIPVRRWLHRHLFVLTPLKGELKGGDLLEMGYKAGPWLGGVLEGVRLERMDGRIKNRDDELLYLLEMTRRI